MRSSAIHHCNACLRECLLGPLLRRAQESPIAGREYQDNSDVCYQPLPDVVPEEQDVHADHDDYQGDQLKHEGCVSSHRFVLVCAPDWGKSGADCTSPLAQAEPCDALFQAWAVDEEAGRTDFGYAATDLAVSDLSSKTMTSCSSRSRATHRAWTVPNTGPPAPTLRHSIQKVRSSRPPPNLGVAAQRGWRM